MGDMNTFGVVYMSTAGRGIVVGIPSGGVGTTPNTAITKIKDRSSSVLKHSFFTGLTTRKS